mmetsp:Transcript_35351/g.82620  ORF Transcript_35351/g.82620 Transcript_35351/m.82620 type:complete len:680 (-) Transcript_35351:79-2118(-)
MQGREARRPSQITVPEQAGPVPAEIEAATALQPDLDPETCVPGAEVVLVKRLEVRRREKELRRLRKENGILKTRYDAECARRDDELKGRLADARLEDLEGIDEFTRRCAALRQAAEEKEDGSQSQMKTMQHSHSEAAQQLRGLYELKLSHEQERYGVLESEKRKLEEDINEVLADREALLEREREAFQAELLRLTAEKDLEIKKHKDIIAFTQHQFEQLMNKASKEHDAEVAQIKVTSVQELDQQKRHEDKLSKEQSTLLFGLDMMEKERERIEKEQNEASMTISNLRSQVEELSRTVKSLETEKRERESTLQDKELKIDTYNSKVSTLKKFKHILDKRLNEVTESLQPKDQMIGQLKESLQELEAEFEQIDQEQRAIQGKIDQKQQQINWLKKEAETSRCLVKERDNIIMRYSMDLKRVVEIRDVSQWGQEIRKMYHSYVLGSLASHATPLGDDVQQQRRLLDRRVTSLATSGNHMEASCKTDVQRRANENAVLVAELNGLRIHSKSLKREHRRLQQKLEELTQRVRRPSASPLLKGQADGDTPTPPDASDATQQVTAPATRILRPRSPSLGLPGPRQQQSSSHGDLSSAAATPARMFGVPPLEHSTAVGRAAAAVVSRRPLSGGPGRRRGDPDKMQLKQLMYSTEVGQQHLQMQKLENKLLQDQVARLAQARKTASA